jgi:hypothetical protein
MKRYISVMSQKYFGKLKVTNHPPPLVGGGLGKGGFFSQNLIITNNFATPTLTLPPQGGGKFPTQFGKVFPGRYTSR